MSGHSGDGYSSLNKREQDYASHMADIFADLHIDKSMVRGRDVVYRPITQTRAQAEFRIEPDEENYLMTNTARLYGKFKVTKGDGTALVATDNVAVVNLLPHALWQQIDVTANEKLITENASATMMYKAYLENLLTYNNDAVNGHLKCSLFWMDTHSKYDDITTGNAGYVTRKNMIKGSRICEFSAPLHLDIFNTDRLLPPRTKLSIKFIRNPDSFCLMAPEDSTFILEIMELKLTLRKIKLDPTITLLHKKMFDQGKKAIIPYSRSSIRIKTVPAGNTSFYWQSVFSGQLPNQLLIVFIEQGVRSQIEKNPWKFGHFDLKHCALNYNGRQIPSEGYNMDFTSTDEQGSLCVEVYRALFDNIGVLGASAGNQVTGTQFVNGAFILAWDFSPDLCLSMHPHSSGVGSIDINFTWRTAIPTGGIEILAFGTSDDALTLSSPGGQYTDIDTKTYEKTEATKTV